MTKLLNTGKTHKNQCHPHTTDNQLENVMGEKMQFIIRMKNIEFLEKNLIYVNNLYIKKSFKTLLKNIVEDLNE